ncbi:MAG: hypothetical protein KDA65_13435 [Planctomycetaceae bacterium]|nr:hypothetical protein [Planctomycetaceae bacterium]
MFLGMGLIVIVIWRQYRIWSIPDVEPFDREAFYSQYSEVNNNIEPFREAHRMLEEVKRKPQLSDSVEQAFNYEEWTALRSTEGWVDRRFSAECRPALEKWLSGGDAGVVLIVNPPQFDKQANVELWTETHEFVILANMECSLLLSEGKPGKALELFRKMLRSLSRFRSAYSVQSGYRLFSLQLGRILRSPELTVEEIRTFQKELRELTPDLINLSEMVKSCHLMLEKHLEDYLQEHQVASTIIGESEAGLRILKLITANWLEYCDRPLENLTRMRIHACMGDSTGFVQYLREQGIEIPGFAPGQNQQCRISYFENPNIEENLVDQVHSLAYSRDLLGGYFSSMSMLLSDQQDIFRMVKQDEIRLALYGFYREQGRFPDKLEELVPDWFAETPGFYVLENRGDDCLLKPIKGSLHSGRNTVPIKKPMER